MVSTRRGRMGGQTTITAAAAAAAENKINNNIETKKNAGKTAREETTGSPIPDYEQIRQQRIRENLEKMQELDLFKVSAALKPKSGSGRPRKTLVPTRFLPQRQRCSSRVKGLTPVNYSDVPDNGDNSMEVDESIEEETRNMGLQQVNESWL